MRGIAHNPSTRIVFDGILSLRVVILALLGVLVLAASAQADVAVPADTAGGPDSQQTTGAIDASGSTEVPADPVKAPDEQVGAEGGEAPKQQVPAEQTETESAEVPPGPTPDPDPEVIAPEPPSEAVAPTPPPEETSEPVLPAPPVEPVEPVLPVTPAEEPSESTQSPPSALATLTSQDSASHAGDDEAPREATASSTLPVLGEPSEPGGPSAQVLAAIGSGPALAGAQSETTVTWRTRELSCELSALGGPMTENCTAGWLGAQRLSGQSPIGLATVAVSLAGNTIVTTEGAPVGGHSRSAVGSPPVSPAPSPAPGGASGATGFASGLALSTFLTLAGLLLLGAPRAMRRLALSCQPWLTACFVLIPERPD